ncbi:MAG: methyltransferase domain-containing protein [Actinomycetota bacterium]
MSNEQATMLDFDEENARRIFDMYQGPDLVARRREGRRALDLRPGERVLDVGCGPGVYAVEIAEEVGPSGRVVAVDNSPDMLAIARQHCATTSVGAVVELRPGEATSLPVEDEAFDAASSVQVLEYVSEVEQALAEIHRALRPGGRTLIWDTDWHATAWHSDDPGRMRRVLEAFDEHLAHPTLPRTLASKLAAVGFIVDSVEAYPVLNLEASPQTYSGPLIQLIVGFVRGRRDVTDEMANAWVAELDELSARGDYFFCGLQVYFVATKP